MGIFNKIYSGALSLIDVDKEEEDKIKERFYNTSKEIGGKIRTKSAEIIRNIKEEDKIARRRFARGYQEKDDPISRAAAAAYKAMAEPRSTEEITMDVALDTATAGTTKFSKGGKAASEVIKNDLKKVAKQSFNKDFVAKWSNGVIREALDMLDEFKRFPATGDKRRTYKFTTKKTSELIPKFKPSELDPLRLDEAEQDISAGRFRPMVINNSNEIIDGDHRYFIATNKNIDEVPVAIETEIRTLRDKGKYAGSESGFIDFQAIGESAKRLGRRILGRQDESSKKVAESQAQGLGRSEVERILTKQEPLSLDSRAELKVSNDTLNTLKQSTSESTNTILSKSVGDNPKEVSRVGGALREVKTRLFEYFQNEAERVRQLVKKENMVIDDASDPYLKMTLYPGRVGAKIEEANREIRGIVKQMSDQGINRREVSDYLIARHAPERNKALGEGAAGVTTQEARQVLAMVDQLPNAEQIKNIANQVQNINNMTLDVLRESGVITDDLYKTLRNKYKNHVPLNRIMEEDDIGQVLSGKGFDVRGSGIRQAKGSQREIADVMANVVANYEQAVIRAEKNIVDQATLAFVRNNKKDLGGLMKITKPKVIGKAINGSPLLERTNDPSVLQMFEHGKRVWIKIENPRLAVALRGVGREKLGTLGNAVASFTRLYSGLATRFNPEFFLPNKIRDLQETAVYLASQKGVGFRGALKSTGRDPFSVRDVIDSLRGNDTAGARMYQELKELGGTTGGFGLSTRKQVEINIDKMEKLANSKTRKVANRLIEYVDNWNEIFEDSTRLSVYKQALSQGFSKDRAAEMAKEASINFNRMGQGGPIINALWMFSNASIQGSTKMIRAMKNPKVAASVATVVGASVGTVSEFNDQVDPEWRNKVSRWDRLNGLPVVLPSTDGKFRYFTVPVSWGIKPIKVMADYAYDAVSGQEFDMKRMVEDTVNAMAEAYNPAGGNDIVSALVPTILDVPVEISRNTTWYGGKIKPDYDPNAPNDIKYFSSLGETTSGKASISVSEFLQDNLGASVSPADINYAYEQYVGGAGRSVSRVANVLGQVTGDKLPLDEYPLVARFYREKDQEEIGSGAGGEVEEIKNILEKQSRERFEVKKEAQKLHEEWSKLPKDQANQNARLLKKENPAVYKALKNVSEKDKKGLSYQEGLILDLGVENGERARYIHEQAQKLKTREEKNAYIAELREKGIASKRVIDQLKLLAR